MHKITLLISPITDCYGAGGSGTGPIPSADDCSEYFLCTNGQVTDHESCSPGFVYDPDSDRCDDPAFVPCANTRKRKSLLYSNITNT